MEQIEVRIEPATRGFTRSQSSGRGELRGWLALPGDEGFDASLPIGRSVDRPSELCPSVSYVSRGYSAERTTPGERLPLRARNGW